MASKSKEWGKEAERIAAEWLMAEGYTIREMNWKPQHSHLEVDIIAERNTTLIFVEVKARTADGQDPIDAVDERKMRLLAKAADIYIRSQQIDYEYRFDIITLEGNTSNYKLDHIPDAFLPPLYSGTRTKI